MGIFMVILLCVFTSQILHKDGAKDGLPLTRSMHPSKSEPRQILGSAYGYLYKAGTEKQNYGLYSYVLFYNHSYRVERFLEELFETTSSEELSGITIKNLNLIYLPTQADKKPSLEPEIHDGSAPPASLFAKEYYDYTMSQRLLTQICTAPAEVIRDVCATALSHGGPYLFTYSHPASDISSVPPPYLFLDLTNVHEHAFSEFIYAYKEQVKRTDYTDVKRIETLRLRLLSIVLIATDWIDPIKDAIEDIIHVGKCDGGA